MVRILVTANFHPNEGGILAARKLAAELRRRGHDASFHKIPFKGSNWEAVSRALAEGSDLKYLDFRRVGFLRADVAALKRGAEVLVDVHTTSDIEFAHPDRNQFLWRQEWRGPKDSPSIDRYERLTHQIIWHVKYPRTKHAHAHVNVEVPAETKPMPPVWEKRFARLPRTAENLRYLAVHRPAELTDRTIKRMADLLERKLKGLLIKREDPED